MKRRPCTSNVVRFFEIEVQPEPGQRVVVVRRDRKTGDFEATLKEYDIDPQGRHILWPKSTDPEFQTPIVLGGQIPLPLGDEAPLAVVQAGQLSDEAGMPDLQIFALVVGS